MPDNKIVFKCDVCGNFYQHGQHRYEGHRPKLYGNIFVCDSCWEGSHDGWALRYEDVLLGHLKRQGLPVPQRNEEGLLPRE